MNNPNKPRDTVEVGQGNLPGKVSELLKHIVTEHKPSDMEFAVMAFGHDDSSAPADANGNRTIHVCQLVGGDPSMVLRALGDMVKAHLRANPHLLPMFLLDLVAFTRSVDPSAQVHVINANDNKYAGMSPEEIVNDFMSKMTGSNPTKH